MPVEFAHRFIPGAMASAPTIVALHGTGGDENELVPLARMIDGDAAILSLRGRVNENGKARFFRRISDGLFDLDDLQAQTAALRAFISEAADHYRIDRSRIVALAYSNGANITTSLLLTDPTALAGAVLLRPMLPFEPPSTPVLTRLPIMISSGREDPIVPPDQARHLATVLEQAGAKVTMLWQETGHALSPNELEQVATWWRATFGE